MIKKAFQRWKREGAVFLVSVSMMLVLYGNALGAPTKSDIAGHWAEMKLREWISKGYLSGYGDGTVKPDQAITRAEFMHLINGSFGITDRETVVFKDLPSSHWAYAEVEKAMKAGYVSGYANGTIRPDDLISRQEAAVMMARLLFKDPTAPVKEGVHFTDDAKLALWSRQSVVMIASNGVMSGFPNGSFEPNLPLKRAEAVYALDAALAAKASAKPPKVRTYGEAGLYGPVDDIATMYGNLELASGDITLQNTRINGDLIITQEAGSGVVELRNVQVKGTITVHSPVTLKLLGNFDAVRVEAAEVEVMLLQGSVKELSFLASSGRSRAAIGPGTKLSMLILDAIVNINGVGIVERAVIHEGGQGSYLEMEPLYKDDLQTHE
jgi:hypothetical protein